MFRPSTRERKIVLLVLLSLTTASVCFGLLESSGYIEKPAITLGGAFVGFLLTFFALDKAWKEDAPRVEPEAHEHGLVYDEVLKLWDFRHLYSKREPGIAILDDYYLIKKFDNVQEVKFHYATTGEIPDHICLTHPETSTWSDSKEPSHRGGDGYELANGCCLTVDLGELVDGQSVPLISQLRFKGAFDLAKDEQWLETHIDHPTGRLGILIVLPEAMHCTHAVAEEKIGRPDNEWVKLHQKPAILQNRTVIYWSISNPKLSVAYQVKWTWLKGRGVKTAGTEARTAVDPPPT